MKKLLFLSIIAATSSINIYAMQKHNSSRKYTVCTPENIHEILATFAINDTELSRLVDKQSTTVFLVKNPQKCYLQVNRHGRIVNTYEELNPKTITNKYLDE